MNEGQFAISETAATMELHVRSLSGEAITVSVDQSNTIRELKLILQKNNFPPASISPNFHLFFKGSKLSLDDRVNSFPFGSDDFILLIPFVKKKERPQTQTQTLNIDHAPAADEQSTVPVDFAESVWSDIKQDLSFPHNTDSPERQFEEPNDTSKRSLETSESCFRQTKRKRSFESDYSDEHSSDIVLLEEVLQSAVTGMFDKGNLVKVMEVLDSVKCLVDQSSGNCIFGTTTSLNDEYMNPSIRRCSSCLCPFWLRTLVKAFAFLNIYSTALHVRKKKITLSWLIKAVEKLRNFGLQVVVSDVEHLAVLCPKVVRIVDGEAAYRRSGDAILIVKDCEQKDDNSCEAKEHAAASQKIVNAMNRRNYTFKSTLSKIVMDFMMEKQVETFSLEDLLITVRRGMERKSTRRNKSNVSGSNSSKFPCHCTNPLLPEEMVEHLKIGLGSQGQIVHVEQISGRTAEYVDIPSELSEGTISALTRIGIKRLYCHQAESIRASLAGKHVVVATMTSSGKSLCYNVPVLEVLFHNLQSCALYLFPTKALAQDQLGKLLKMTKGFDDDTLKIGIYDGDTSKDDRMWLRENARLLITNPDMLNVSIMPHHGQFRRILSNLRFVIVDEAHAYRGAFGCHTALILRRLRRICSHAYGSDPSFVLSTATSGNPREHAMELASLPDVELIQNDCSPSGPKLFVLWNPPLRLRTVQNGRETRTRGNAPDNKHVVAERSSPAMEVSHIFAEMVQHGLRCIAFCRSRKLCELVLCYTREILQKACPSLVDSICSYRGGYNAEDRRNIEKDIFSGRICGVAATSALELGIDVGYIDATLHLGFPGSIASLRQQAGRAGRREKPSLAVYVAFDGPLDQYFMKNPEKLFQSPIECCHINVKNKKVLEKHLPCAALEYPLSIVYDKDYFSHGLEDAIMTLKNSRLLTIDDSSARMWSYIGPEKSPSQSVNIRGIETERYTVINEQNNQVLEEIEESMAFFQVYEGAVYMNQGRTYLVNKLDQSSKSAWCKQADLDYYTRTRDYTDVVVMSGRIAYPARTNHHLVFPRTTSRVDDCKVTTTWFGFYRIRKRSNEVFDTVELTVPDYTYDSQAVWIQVPQSIKPTMEALSYSFRGGLHAVGHALLKVVPLYVRCNSSDIATECVNQYDSRDAPERILIYDPHPGGTGIAAQVQPVFTELLVAALDLLISCQCKVDVGCPNCAQSHSCREYNEVIHKDAAIMIIKAVLDAERSFNVEVPDSS